MILSFKDKLTQAVAEGRAPKGFPAELVRGAQRKLAMLNAARSCARCKLKSILTSYSMR